MRYSVFIIINLALLLLGYRWVTTHVEFSLLVESLRLLKVEAILVSCIPYSLLLLLYGYRMSQLIKCSWGKAFSISMIGHGFNNLFPFRLGEPLRVVLVRRLYGIRMEQLGLAIVLEKAFDLLILGFLGAFVVYSVWGTQGALLLGGSFFLALLIVGWVTVQGDLSSMLPKARWIQRGVAYVNQAMEQCALKENIVGVLLSSLGVWLLAVLQFYSYFSFSIETFLWRDAVILVLVVAAAFALPITISSVGIFEGGIVWYLTERGVETEQALVLAMVLHVIVVVPQIVGAFGAIVSREWRVAKQ